MRSSIPASITPVGLTQQVLAIPLEGFPSYRANAGAAAMRDNTVITRMEKTNALVMRFAPWAECPISYVQLV